MARNAISRELYNDLVARGMIKDTPGQARRDKALAAELRVRKCKNKGLALAMADVLDPPRHSLALPLVFVLDWPPSLNAMWATAEHEETGASIRVLTAKAKAWRKKALLDLQVFFGGHGLTFEGPLSLELAFHGRFFHANGIMRKLDLSNRIKLLEDTVATALHYDDCRHWQLALRKVPDEREFVQVTITPAPPIEHG